MNEQVVLRHGPAMPNGFMLAPLTNLQSHEDGELSDEEYRWLCMRAEGGFGLVMTCASHVQAIGKGFPGQLGCWSDRHLPGLERLASGIRKHGSLAWVQLHHAGMRSPQDLIGTAPVCPSDDKKTGARALSTGEVGQLVDDFVAAAVRADRSGFDGVEIHGAHGYILCQFLSGRYNRRTDEYGGSLDERSRIIYQVIEGVRSECRDDFQIGVRLSPERFGMQLNEILDLAAALLQDQRIDLLDMSLWDVFKTVDEGRHEGESLLGLFCDLPRNGVRLTAAGKIRTPDEVSRAKQAGLDIVTLGRAGILNHDYPKRFAQNPGFTPNTLPVSRALLANEGVSPAFVDYLAGWEGFVSDTATQ